MPNHRVTDSDASTKTSESGAILSALLSRISIPFAVFRPDGAIHLASGSFADLFSFRDSVLGGMDICDLFLPGDRERFTKVMNSQVCDPDRSASLSVTGVSRDGRHLALIASISSVSCDPTLLLATFEDKSDAQQDLIRIEKLEHQAAIGTFTSSVAHEFNNVLSGIRGYSQLAQNDPGDRTLIQKAFQIIEQESIRGAELCKNLSLYSGNRKLALEPVAAQEIIPSTLDLQEKDLRSDNVAVVTRIEGDLPPFLADRFKLQQVLLNLLINARHAIIPKGKGTIVIAASREAEDIVLSVTDDGTGIEPFNIPRIFDPFFSNKDSAESTGGFLPKGTGLGLPVCQSIVRQHGGSIEVTSVRGEGSTFSVRIPFHFAERRVRKTQEEAPAKRTNAAPPSILIVDDEMPIREVLYRSLSPVSPDITLARNAAECEKLLSERAFDIVFLDYILPEMNADRLLPVIRSACPGAKVVIVSGWNSSPVKKEAVKKLVDGWIEKPFNVESVLAAVEQLR